MKLNSHFSFPRKQRSEIIILLLLIICGLMVYSFVEYSSESALNLNSPKIQAIQREWDSLQKEKIDKNAKKTPFPFNPNFIDDYKGYILGMSNEEIDRLLAFRKQGKWVNSVKEFQVVTGVSDSLLTVISPHFAFPEWINESARKANAFPKTKEDKVKPFAEKKDLNTVSAEDLQQVRGIGPAYSERIIKYREKLGGFSADTQLYEVFGLDSAVVARTLNSFTVKTPKEISKLNINKASASDLATLPGISFDLAKRIWEYRKLRGTVQNLEELKKVAGITEGKFKQIQLYLSVE